MSLELAGQQRLPGFGPAAGAAQGRGGLPATSYAGTTRRGPTVYIPPSGKVTAFKAAPVVFDLFLDFGNGIPVGAQIVAKGYADLNKILKQRYPGVTRVAIVNEARRPLGPPYTEFPWAGEQRERERVKGSTVELMRRTLPPEMRLERDALS